MQMIHCTCLTCSIHIKEVPKATWLLSKDAQGFPAAQESAQQICSHHLRTRKGGHTHHLIPFAAKHVLC